VNVQHTALTSEKPSRQASVVTFPARFKPKSDDRPLLRPKPTMVAVVPIGGPVEARRDDAIPVTGVVSWSQPGTRAERHGAGFALPSTSRRPCANSSKTRAVRLGRIDPVRRISWAFTRRAVHLCWHTKR
jgi:hypothetical protein